MTWRPSLAGTFVLCVACGPAAFTEPQTLGGDVIDAATLETGRETYTFYCAACHGENGDGRGPASAGLMTPPRDFRIASFKFSGITEGFLPHDEDLLRIVKGGLRGTAMLTWDIPESTLMPIIAYIKTFSPPEEGWRDPDMEKGEPIVGDNDPWGPDRSEEAIARGEAIYHGVATCHSCHPTYVTTAEINGYRVEQGMGAMESFRDRMWLSETKPSVTYSAPIPGDPPCEADSDCDDTAAEAVCRYGRCERQLRILPPDFMINEMRGGSELSDLFRTIAAGIPGTAMPAWQGALPDEDIWAMAYYVHYLGGLKSSTEIIALKARLKADAGQ